jgi:hypothetical protein
MIISVIQISVDLPKVFSQRVLGDPRQKKSLKILLRIGTHLAISSPKVGLIPTIRSSGFHGPPSGSDGSIPKSTRPKNL